VVDGMDDYFKGVSAGDIVILNNNKKYGCNNLSYTY